MKQKQKKIKAQPKNGIIQKNTKTKKNIKKKITVKIRKKIIWIPELIVLN